MRGRYRCCGCRPGAALSDRVRRDCVRGRWCPWSAVPLRARTALLTALAHRLLATLSAGLLRLRVAVARLLLRTRTLPRRTAGLATALVPLDRVLAALCVLLVVAAQVVFPFLEALRAA